MSRSRFSDETRQAVRIRANGRCEYCGKPDQYTSYAYHIDHILPVKRHGGTDEMDNLAWACFECNTNKSGEISGYENGNLTPLYNPRTMRWEARFEWDGALIVGKTPIALVTIRLLYLNTPERLEIRRELMEAGNW